MFKHNQQVLNHQSQVIKGGQKNSEFVLKSL